MGMAKICERVFSSAHSTAVRIISAPLSILFDIIIGIGWNLVYTCPKQKMGTKGQPFCIAIFTKPFLDLMKATYQKTVLGH
jgi:hypothetical protein